MRIASIITCLAVAAAACGFANPSRAADAPATPSPAVQLQRGVNLSHWFSQLYGEMVFGPEHVTTQYTDRDFELLARLGFDHVRLPIDPVLLSASEGSLALDESKAALLDEALEKIRSHGLGVILDCHPKNDFKARLATDPAFVAELVAWWEAFAARYADTDPTRVCLQLMNEPQFAGHYEAWPAVQLQLAEAARRGAPKHTLLLTSHAYSDINDVTKMTPIADPNVVYAFHMYRPSTFTHQGAIWGNAKWKELQGVPYPATKAGVEPLLAKVTEDGSRQLLVEYAEKQWDAQQLRDLIGKAAAWADEHDVAVMCTEFGVYRTFAPPADRAQWLADVVAAFDAHDIPWSMWDYNHGFGLLNHDNGQPVLPAAVLHALGISVKETPSWLTVTE